MRELGVSVYPDYGELGEIKAYLLRAKAWGFKRVFSSLLLGHMGFEDAGSAPADIFSRLALFCAEHELRLCADADEAAFSSLGARFDDLSVFHRLGIHTLRIDGGFTPEELIRMSLNPWGIRIEINASALLFSENGTMSPETLRNLLSGAASQGNLKNLSACHNFYPLPDTGLDISAARAVKDVFHEFGICVGAFAASRSAPPLLYAGGHGLPTIEAHRHLPPHVAAAELFAAGFDSVTIGDYPASDSELELVAKAAGGPLDIPIVFDERADRALLEKLPGTPLLSRADQPERVIRSEVSRGISAKPQNAASRPAFTVTVCNELAGRYMGELQITLCDLAPSPGHNVIGSVHPDARRLLPYIKGGAREFTLSECVCQNRSE